MTKLKPRDKGFHEVRTVALVEGAALREVERFSIRDGTGVRVLDEHPLDGLMRRGTIDRRQHDAGIMYYGQWLRAAPGGYTAVNPDNINAGDAPRRSEFTPAERLDADRAIREADAAVGAANAVLIRYVCAEAKEIAGWVARQRQAGHKTNPHREMGRLLGALEALAAHYRL